MNVATWLRRLGLGQYEQAFRENDIDESVLSKLTADDLISLGVNSVGHRRKLLDSIATLQGISSSAAELTRAEVRKESPPSSAERRQLTVMFCDLVGSTALSASMDPEDLREIIAAYQKCAAETVRRFDGFVAKYLGDGILVYFGYPQAHEDDAERAVRAGLELIAAVGALKSQVPLKTRIGIGTGLVIVGDLIGSGEAQERGIVGETPNLAARLQGIAEPNSVIVAEATHELLGRLFEFKDLGPQDLKGFTTRVRAWVVLRPAVVESRFDALHGAELTPFVGREEESAVLLRCWQSAKAREGQVVLLAGEPGIGKSRLTVALLERIVTEPHTRLRYFCSPQHVDSALHPIIGQLERAAGFGYGDDAQSRLDKLDALLARSGASPQDCSLIAELLSLPASSSYPTLELTPEQRRQRTLEALTTQLQALARERPVLMIFEDVHWIDPTSLEVLSRTVELVAAIPVLLIVTFRPEFDPPWTSQPNVSELTLNRLDRRDAGAIIERIVKNKPLSREVVTEIIERTDGVPLFVEEMTKAVLESGEAHARHIVSAVPSYSLAVPATLHASLMARLDRLGSAKDIAQIGAAIGRNFSYELLAAVTGPDKRELAAALDRLTDARLVFRQGTPPHASYLFKHAFVQDAAYSTLLRGPRQKLHAQIAKVLEGQFPERANVEPELLARHLTEAGEIKRAISYWLKAGLRAAERSANSEALGHLKRGLALLTTLPESAERDRSELDFQLALGSPTVAVHGWASPEVAAARDRSASLCEKLGDTEHLLPALYGQCVYCINSGKTRMALGLAKRCRSLAKGNDDRVTRLIGHRAMGVALMQLGEFGPAKAQFEQILSRYDHERDHFLATQFVTDPCASGGAFLALDLWALGYPAQAIVARDRAFTTAAELNHANSNGFVWFFAGAQLSELIGDKEGIKNYADKVITLSTQYHLPTWQGHGDILAGWSLASNGQLEEGIKLIDGGIRKLDEIGTAFHRSHYLALLAMLHARAGNGQASLSAISEAKSQVAATEEYFWQAEVHRIEGELRLLLGVAPEQTEWYFCQALDVARQQQAKSFELRAAIALARLWRDRGKRNQACDYLTPLYSWFTEGFDTADMKEARALLDQLG